MIVRSSGGVLVTAQASEIYYNSDIYLHVKLLPAYMYMLSNTSSIQIKIIMLALLFNTVYYNESYRYLEGSEL